MPRTYALIWGRSVFTEAQLLGLTGVLVLLVRGRARGIGWRITGLATVVPVVVIAATGAVIFDGIRHLLFAAVCATTLAGVGASWLVAADRHPLLRYAAGVLLAVAVARAAQVSIRLHPYESTYFNDVVVGGLAGAEGRFDTDYWGAALTEAAVWTVEHVEPRRDGRRLRVVSTHHRAQVARALHGSGFEFVGSYSGSHELFTHPYRDPPDIYIAGTRWHRDDVYPGEVVHRVARDGVTLAVVKLVDREACRKLEHGDADGAGRERPRPLEGR